MFFFKITLLNITLFILGMINIKAIAIEYIKIIGIRYSTPKYSIAKIFLVEGIKKANTNNIVIEITIETL